MGAVGRPMNVAAQSIARRKGVATRHIGKPTPSFDVGAVYMFTAGTAPFAPSKSGYWKFVLWGGGGNGSSSGAVGGSGAYLEYTRYLDVSARPSVTIGGDSSVTFADGTVVTAGGGQNGDGGGTDGLGGVATGGDYMLNGSTGSGVAGAGTGGGASGVPGSGSSAPGRLPFRGGRGRQSDVGGGGHGGGGPNGGATEDFDGYRGLGLVLFVRD